MHLFLISSSIPTEASQDDWLASVADKVHGFSGYYQDNNGRLKLRIKSNVGNNKKEAFSTNKKNMIDKLSQMDARLTDLLKRYKGKIDIIDSDYDFAELQNLRKKIRRIIIGKKGVVSLDIDERSNRVVVGLSDSIYQKSIEEQLAKAELSKWNAAIKYIVQGQARVQASIRGALPEKLAGTEISFFSDFGTGFANCSLGVVTTIRGQQGFLTNSHCTKTGVVFDGQNTEYFQTESDVIVDGGILPLSP